MKKNFNRLKLFSYLTIINLLIVSCGGGGSSSTNDTTSTNSSNVAVRVSSEDESNNNFDGLTISVQNDGEEITTISGSNENSIFTSNDEINEDDEVTIIIQNNPNGMICSFSNEEIISQTTLTIQNLNEGNINIFCFLDSDSDGVINNNDDCPNDANNTDGCDESDDLDGDGVNNDNDNCPQHANANQLDTDNDGIGNTCDSNDDGDDFDDIEDLCPLDNSSDQTDTDNDGIGDICDDSDDSEEAEEEDDDQEEVEEEEENQEEEEVQEDLDNDGVADESDNCPNLANANQLDSDNDGIGNACDNCPNHSNVNQSDVDNDNTGDACDVETCDGVDNDGDNDIDEGFDVGGVCGISSGVCEYTGTIACDPADSSTTICESDLENIEEICELTKTCVDNPDNPGNLLSDQSQALAFKLDNNDIPNISRVATVSGDLYYSTLGLDNQISLNEVVDDRISLLAADEVYQTDLYITTDDDVVICYRNAQPNPDELSVAIRTGVNTWDIDIILASNNLEDGCALGEIDGKIVVSFADDGEVEFYTRNDDNDWVASNLGAQDGNAGADIAMAIDGEDIIITHQETLNLDLVITTRIDGVWDHNIIETELEDGKDSSIIFDEISTTIVHGGDDDGTTSDTGFLYYIEDSLSFPLDFTANNSDTFGEYIDISRSGESSFGFTRQFQRSALFGNNDALIFFPSFESNPNNTITIENHSAAQQRHSFQYLDIETDSNDLPVLVYSDSTSPFGDDDGGEYLCIYRPTDDNENGTPDILE